VDRKRTRALSRALVQKTDSHQAIAPKIYDKLPRFDLRRACWDERGVPGPLALSDAVFFSRPGDSAAGDAAPFCWEALSGGRPSPSPPIRFMP
tara:strand:+ start:218 stop:496 length:279 start_codon:yes stop_codon:yes gene_type:complete